MNTLLIFFALPIAVIIISIALQKIFKCPFLVAGIIFAIFLIVTFSSFGSEFLVATIAYTILAYITALIIKRLEDRNNSLQTIEEIIINNNENTNVVATNNSCGCNNRYRRF